MKLDKIFTIIMALVMMSTTVGAQSYRSLMRKANTQYELNAYNLAIPNYQAALQKKPKSGEAMTKLANCYRMLNKMDDAAKYYANGVRMDGIEKKSILEYGHTLKALQRYDEAKQFYLLYARDVDQMVGSHYAESCDFAKAQLGVNSSYSVTNELVNTSASDFGATFYGTEQVVYSSARTDIIRSSSNWTGKANNQLFLAAMAPNGYLASPTFLKSPDVEAFNEGPLTFSPDGKTVVYTKNNFVDGTRQIPESGMKLSMFIAEVSNRGDWVNVTPFPYNGTDYSTGYPSFSPDGNSLYFASDRPDGFGGYDIYVSYRTGTTWTAPQNLGPIVNSPGNEITPFYDGDMLFFASDYHPGLGGLDMFRAESVGGRWTKVFHMGNAVNSSYDDYGYVYDAFSNTGYLTSNRLNGRGNEDIYKVARSADYITIRVLNAADGSVVPNALVDFSDCGEGVYSADDRGFYSFQAVQGLDCNLMIRKDGYMSSNVRVSTIGLNNQKDFTVNLIRPGEAYAGKVIDKRTGFPLNQVVVTAFNQATGNQVQVQTDDNGDYYLSLSPYAGYMLRFSRQGFRDLEYVVRTDDGLDRTILGVTSLPPSDSPLDPDEVPVGPVEPAEMESGYAVQLAYVSNAEDMSVYDKMMDEGTVYDKEVNGKHKIRVGIYETKEEAKRVQAIARKRGYKGAFVVEEEGAVTQSGGGSSTSGTEKDGEIDAIGRYKVQLAAYSNLKYFDDSKIKNLGVIEEQKKGSLTVKYIGGFDTLSEAQYALRKAQQAGFRDAYVVENINGLLKKVK